MLRFIVFVSGAVLMALEIVGSRVLAPYFGSSIFVWGSLISIFLGALSLGYYWGGNLADKRPRFRVLGVLVAVPGFLIISMPFYAEPLNLWIWGLDIGPRFSPLVAALSLFFLPSVFLGTVSPYAIKLGTKSLDTVGNTAGRLYALSTVGSIVGTLTTSFFLIPALGVQNIVETLGWVLLGLSGFVLLFAPRERNASETGQEAGRRRLTKTVRATLGIIGLIFVASLVSWQFTGADSKVLFKKDSMYHRIIVEDHLESRLRHLHFDNTYQSAMDLDDPDKLVFEYTQYLHLGMAFAPEAREALFVGLGAGSAPKRFARDYPDLHIDVAEIDPEVVHAAKKYFGFRESSRLKVYVRDGRLFIKEHDKKYDMIVFDAYNSDSIPFHLTTAEFLREVSADLKPDGVVVANIIGTLSGDGSRLFRSMVKTYQAVFPQVYEFPVGRNRGVQDTVSRNIILIATKSPQRIPKDVFTKKVRSLQDVDFIKLSVDRYATHYLEGIIGTNDVPVLTDDYAPVDSLQHFN